MLTAMMNQQSTTPNQPSKNPRDDRQYFYQKGQQLASESKYEEAIASYDKYLEMQPDDNTAWVLRGAALTHLDRYEEALISFEEALKVAPEDNLAMLFRGMALQHMGDYQKAYESFDTTLGIKRNPFKRKIRGMLNWILDFVEPEKPTRKCKKKPNHKKAA
ncbi:MAG: tetratricopeptide repeat protein [Oscillatoria sp. PMC 1051.18]|nr:tetratricopeptide repeat protein [Oscillatoria sp. PMC 1050.18]MEC5031644.1 tetratricopeptide repeat protein [Oscillatoria sp. PMC 1051.18]